MAAAPQFKQYSAPKSGEAITISNGKGASIVMIGPTVTINQGAMAIT